MLRSSPGPSPSRPRALYAAVALFYTALFFALIWPVYPWFATIEPRVLSMPFSLFYVVVALLLSFFGLLFFYLWERRGETADQRPTTPSAGTPSGREPEER